MRQTITIVVETEADPSDLLDWAVEQAESISDGAYGDPVKLLENECRVA